MKNIYLKFSFLFLIALLGCSEEKVEGLQYGSVSGRVVAENSFEPMANVKIFSNPSSSTIFTDENGNFTIPNVPTGQYSFQAQKENYITKFESVTVTEGTNTTVVFEIKLSTTNNRAPETPVLVLPEDNSTGQNLQVDLSWTATDIDNDSLTFEVTLRNDANDEVVIYSDLEEKSLTLDNLQFGTKYFWQVASNDGINPPVLSQVRSFTTTFFPITRFLFVKKLSDNNVIYAGDESGNQVQLTSSETNSWRPRKNTQSNKIAFIRSNGSQNHIYTMNPDGSAVFKVTSTVPIAGFNPEYLGFCWNNSGSQILFANFDKLYRINIDGSGQTQVFQTPNGKLISEIDWSYDGTKVALKVNNVNGYGAEIYIIGMDGAIQHQVISGTNGAIGGLNFSVTGQKLIFTRDVSGFENPDYRQLDTRIFEHSITSGTTTQFNVERPSGTVDIDVRYSPNESELLFTNTSNDFMSVRVIQKYTIGELDSRITLFTNATMPDWE